MMFYMQMRMDMHFIFMLVTMYMYKIAGLKQFRIFQYYFGLARLDYCLVMVKYVNDIGYLFHNM